MPTLKLDHVNIRTKRLDESIAFYGGILGLEMRPPPSCADMSTGAYGYDDGGLPVVHLVGTKQEVESGAPVRGVAQRGMIDHFAFRCQDVGPVLDRLSASGLPFSQKDVAMIAMRLVFVRDPNDVLVELGCPLPEATSRRSSSSE
jgi:catechol 2,3-dioxygenase-like lactoylglutathione lyase family enzyme